MSPFDFGDHKFTGGQTALVHDNLEQTRLHRSCVGEQSLWIYSGLGLYYVDKVEGQGFLRRLKGRRIKECKCYCF